MTWATVEEPKKEKKSSFKPSAYQENIFSMVDAVLGNGEHIVVEAVAGSGKSTTGIEIFRRLPDSCDSAFVAFNSMIAKELGSRLPRGANARTYHSLGLATLKRSNPGMSVDQDKVEGFLKTYVGWDKWTIPSTRKLVSYCKGHVKREFTNEDLDRIAFSHDIDLYNEPAKEKIFDAVHAALHHSIEHVETVDFDDMIWLPNVLDHVLFYDFDFLFIDEVQDTNTCQLYLAMNSIAENGTICGVGDRNQSIYAFRGANSTAMDRLSKELSAHEMPLSISYRCPQVIRKYVNDEFPYIKFEVPENAIEGTINNVSMDDKFMESVQPGDMILCRVNADLVSTAFRFIRSGRKATIQGRDIGKGLVDLIKKTKKDDVNEMLAWVDDWKRKEITKAYLLGMESKVQYITDRADTIFALSEGATSSADVMKRCYDIFSDDQGGIKLSSVHRAKGLEADNVFILRPDLMPHPSAKKEEDKRQEANLRYVAATRARKNLTFVL